MSKKWVAMGFGAVLFASVLALAFYWSRQRPHETLSVARLALPVTALTYIAEAKGYFAEEGVDVSFTEFPTGREALNSACAGNQDLATAFTTPVVRDIVTGRDLVILTTLHQSSHNTSVVALASHGINEAKDLAGKTIGYVEGTSAEFFLYTLLTDAGVDPDSVVRVNVLLPKMEPALKEGRVDAVVTWHPYLYQLEQSFPKEQLRIFHSEVYVEISMLVGRREVVARKSKAISCFLRALARAQELLTNDPAEARHAENVQATGMAHIDADSPIWNDFTPALGLNHVMLLSLEQDAEWMRTKRIVSGPLPAFRRYIADSYLRTIMPDIVTLPISDGSRKRDVLDADLDGVDP